jgi:pSer/pThr/pTyr-binding forkhead associated (FHA) protein
MPKLKTREAPPMAEPTAIEPDRLAMGLHYSARAQTFFFDDFRVHAAIKRLWSIGRGRHCDLRLKDAYVSNVHAIVQRRKDGAAILCDHDSTNGICIDGRLIDEPVIVTVGMRVQMGQSLLIGVDGRGSFPIAAHSIPEFCRKAAELYGNNTLAGEHVGRSREYVRRLRDLAAERSGAR